MSRPSGPGGPSPLRFAAIPVALWAIALVASVGDAAAAAPSPPPGCSQSTNSASVTPNTAIPDNNATPPIESTLPLSGLGPVIADVDVTTNIPHEFGADLDILLTSPAGTTVSLSTDNAGGNDNTFAGTTWDDAADPDGEAPYTTNANLATDHPYANLTLASPLAPEEPLGAFRGENPNGTWTLSVDDDAAGDLGTLVSWGLSVTTLDVAPTLSTAGTVSRSAVLPIPDAGSVQDTAQVSGLPSSLYDLDAELRIQHPNATDIDVTLRAPSGRVVTLTTDNGGSNDNVFDGTLFDDDAGTANAPGPVTDVMYADATVETPVAPEEAFASLAGEGPNGTWTLTASDDLANNTGQLSGWSLSLVTASCAPELALTMSGTPAAVPAGGQVAYALEVSNTQMSAADVRVADTLPSGATLVSATPSQGTCDGPNCRLGTLAGGSTAQIALVARLDEAGVATNLATVTSPSGDSDAANNTASVRTTVEAPPSAGAIDTTAPTFLGLAASPQKLAKALRRGVAGLIACTEACTVEAELLRGSRVIGRARATLGDARTATLRVKPRKRPARRLRRRGGGRVTLRWSAVDAAGNRSPVSTRRVRLKR